MQVDNKKLGELRTRITESLRVQRDGGETVPYIDVGNNLSDMCARQNHVVFARRGCGKTLLLHQSAHQLSTSIRAVYLNCEDFKRHSFPNVLVEIVDSLFAELEKHLTGWFGKKRQSRKVISNIRAELDQLRASADAAEESIKQTDSEEKGRGVDGSLAIDTPFGGAKGAVNASGKSKTEVERSFRIYKNKLQQLDLWLPKLKAQVREFFDISTTVKAVFIQVDDLYHLKRADQPFVVDYLHRLCKDVPLYFKIASLRHASTLYVDFQGQPIGAQERHDYQPLNIDYTFADFSRTKLQNERILHEFGNSVGMKPDEINSLFKGEGFSRLVMAGGGVPRDTLSLFLEVLGTARAEGGGRIGKDEVRVLSKANFERRIEELKHDSEGGEQDQLMRGIYALREFCLSKTTNAFVVSEKDLQQNDSFRGLFNQLLDYRIIHNAGSALTHKSQSGTYQAFAIDIGCYAHLRKLEGRFTEIDLASPDAKEKLRSTPVFSKEDLGHILHSAPENVESALLDLEELPGA